jgi:uncharacterized protein (DUF305 family)
MKNCRLALAISLAGTLVSTSLPYAVAAQPASSMPGGHMNTGQPGDMKPTPSTKAFMTGTKAMRKNMGAPYSGDADEDFVSHMIPHHQGAVDMAQVELKYGKDPEMRKLAKEIIEAQHKEITLMKQWQGKHAAK